MPGGYSYIRLGSLGVYMGYLQLIWGKLPTWKFLRLQDS